VAATVAVLARSFLWSGLLPAELGVLGVEVGLLLQAIATAGVFGGLYLGLGRGVLRR
jgi:hypothetical protein